MRFCKTILINAIFMGIVIIRIGDIKMALDYNIIGERLKKARQNKHMTQEKFTEKLDMSVAYLYIPKPNHYTINF